MSTLWITKNVYFGQRSDIFSYSRFQFADEMSHEFELHSNLHFCLACLTTNQDYHFIAMISLASKKKKFSVTAWSTDLEGQRIADCQLPPHC